MTQEDKELLQKDLCARSPYGLICSIYRIDDCNVGWRDEKLTGYFMIGTEYEFYFGESPISIDNIFKIKPYLRPLSSMTEVEKLDYTSIDNRAYCCPQDFAHIPATDRIDWLNKHHFDYRGLIKKGLAMEAPKGMYIY